MVNSSLLIQAKQSMNINVRTSLDKYTHVSASDHNMALKAAIKAVCVSFSLVRLGPKISSPKLTLT